MKLVLKPGARRARVLAGHPWVFVNEINDLPDPAPDGEGVPLEDARGRFLGMGIVNSASQIVWRRYSRKAGQPWDRSFFHGALTEAMANREEEPFRRLVWSEADDLPGLVVDQFDDVLVVQALTLAVDRALPVILELLEDLLHPREILVRNDAPSRQKEGMPLEAWTRSGDPLVPFWGDIYGISHRLDLQASHKTGFYLDQRHEHFKVSTLAPGWRVLDAFCNQGAFALHCARAGAREVVAVDSSAEALALGRETARHNDLSVSFLQANVFDYFREHPQERFDLIILDPPSFAPNRRSLPTALRGYKECHLQAFRSLNKGGILATYCCSHHVNREAFLQIITEAAADIRRKVQLLYDTGQPLDHPVLLAFPESSYLKGFVLRMQD